MAEQAPTPPPAPKRSEKADAAVTAEKKARFLAALLKVSSIGVAAQLAGVDRSTPARWGRTDPEFQQRFRDAQLAATEVKVENLELKAYELAMKGDKILLIFLLKCLYPEQYAERTKTEHSLDTSALTGLADRLATMLRKHIPEACPSCHIPLDLKAQIAIELQAITQDLAAQGHTQPEGPSIPKPIHPTQPEPPAAGTA